MAPRRRSDGGPVLAVERLRAYYQMKYFGIDREVRAVDDITLHVNRNEIYGLAGESSSGKTSFIKTIAAANRPPLNVVGGSVKFSFLDRDIHSLDREALAAVRWKHLSYIMQGSMNVLNPVRRVQRILLRLRLRAHRASPSRSSSRSSRRTSSGCTSSRRCSTPIRTSCPAACASGSPSRSRRSAGPSSSSPTSRRPRSTWSCRRACSAMIREIQREMRLVDPVRHARHGGARQHGRPARHHVCRPPGRGGADRARSSRGRCTPTPRT